MVAYFQKPFVSFALMSLFFFFAGLFVHQFFTTSTINKAAAYTPLRQHGTGYTFINPLLAVGDIEYLRSHTKLRNTLQGTIYKYEDSHDLQTASVYVRTLIDGKWTSVNRSERYSPASLYKAVLLIAYLKKAETQSGILQEKTIFGGSIEKEQGDEFEPMVKGHTYTVWELLERLIIYSDNDAKNLLHQHLDLAYINHVFSDLSLPVPDEDDNGDITTVDLYSIFFRVLYNATYLNKPMSEMALQLLSKVDFRKGIVAGIEADIPVAHKFGHRVVANAIGGHATEQLHDCGIVYHPKHPYFICIMTKGYTVPKLEDIIARLSHDVYEYIDTTYN